MMTTNRMDDLPDLPEPVRRTQPWGLGWRLNHAGTADSWGDLLDRRVFGHTGSVGNMVWMDPQTQGFCILLTNYLRARAPWRLVPRSNAIAAAFNCLLSRVRTEQLIALTRTTAARAGSYHGHDERRRLPRVWLRGRRPLGPMPRRLGLEGGDCRRHRLARPRVRVQPRRPPAHGLRPRRHVPGLVGRGALRAAARDLDRPGRRGLPDRRLRPHRPQVHARRPAIADAWYERQALGHGRDEHGFPYDRPLRSTVPLPVQRRPLARGRD